MLKTIILIAITCSVLFTGPVNAQSPTIKWWYDTNDAAYGQSAAGDIDGDGKLEVVFGCYRKDSSVYALNAENGSLLWKYNTHPAGAEGCNDAAPLICDVDNDDSLEVIVASSCNPTTFCFNGRTGAVKWQTPTRGSDSPPTFADIDNDGKPEILHGEFGGYVICINAENGSAAWEIPVDLNSWIQTAPTIVDLDNDGQLDFVVATWTFSGDTNKVYAYRGNDHALLWKYLVYDVTYHGTAVADLDKDGKPELVIGSYNDTLYCINGENGTTRWKFGASGGYCGAPATIGDIDNDGNCDVVFVSGYKVTALSGAGIYKWHYNIPGYQGAFRGVALSDITNDDYLDVIFGTDDGKVIALNGNNGSLIWTKDLAAHYGNSAFGFDHAPLIADFDDDDSLDVFLVGGYGSYPPGDDFGRAYMITAGIGHGPDWMMFQHDIRRQSSLCDFTTNTENGINLANTLPIDVFPNPSGTSATIRFPNPRNEPHSILIFNATGQVVKKIDHITGAMVKIDNIDCPGGLYFFQLRNNQGVTGQGKFLVE